LAGGAALAAATAIAVLVPDAPPHPADRPATATSAATTTVRTVYAVFRGRARSRDTTRDGTARAERQLFPVGSSLAFPGDAVDVDHARRLAVPDREVWVAPATVHGRPGVCMRVASALSSGVVTGACARLGAAVDDGLWMSGRPAPTAENASWKQVDGLVPDGVDEVVFRVGRGVERRVRVHDNAVSATFERGPLAARFVDAAGRTHRVRF
ncbi:hypothetical protein ACVU7I_18960, partial [Patulibacter sp. S7RM1-6]